MGFLMRIFASAVLLAALGSPAFADFKLSFGWGDIPMCTSGRPNRVGNPAFTLTNVPDGTTVIEFKMVDLDVPRFNHGGGKVKVKQGGSYQIPSGAFKYKSPCPPDGSHVYEWTATAKAGRKVLATATSQRLYPE